MDYILRGWPIRPELRKVDKSYTDKVETVKPVVEETKPVEPVKTPEENPMNFSFSRQNYCEQNKPLRKVYLYAVSRTIVEKIIELLNFNVEITKNVDDADIVLAHKNFAKGGAKVLNTAKEYRAQIFYVKTNSMAQIQKVLKDALDIRPYDNPEDTGYNDESEKALDEVKTAVKQVLEGAPCVELAPQNTQIRKLQHDLVEQYGLQSTSIGEGENRHLRVSR